MPSGDPVLEARDVRKVFGSGVTALAGVDLTVYGGDWVALTGPSGAGKTSLLHLFAALDSPTSGQVLYQGRDLSSLRDLDTYRRTQIGIVFQLHNLLPHLNVRDNIEVAMMGTGLSHRARIARIDQLVHEVGLDDQQLRSPPELSGGERQRAAIARALANDPQVLLADEPTGSLDPDHVGRLLHLLEHLNQERHMTIVMVTHDPDVAARSGRVVTLAAGKITTTTSTKIP